MKNRERGSLPFIIEGTLFFAAKSATMDCGSRIIYSTGVLPCQQLFSVSSSNTLEISCLLRFSLIISFSIFTFLRGAAAERGAAAFPLLWDLEPYMAVYRATVTVSRYTAEGGAEPALAAQETTTYLCYENLGPNNTDRAWVDLDSAETAWDASEAAFAALAPS